MVLLTPHAFRLSPQKGVPLTIKKFIFLIFLIPLFVGIIYLSRAILMPFILAFFLAYALNPLVEFLQKKGARRDWAILTIYIVVFIVGAMILELLIPRLIRDLTAVIQKLPVMIKDIQTILTKLNEFFDGWSLPFNPKLIMVELSKRSEAALKFFLVQLGRSTINFFSKSLLYALIPFIAYYISRDYPRLKQLMLRWICQHLGNHWTRTILKIDAVFRYYIRS